jgi:hypothetical protein
MTPPPDGQSRGHRPWPTVAAGSPSAPAQATFAPGPAPQPIRRLLRRHFFGLLALSLLVVSGILVLVVFLLRPPPPKHCPRLFVCGGPVAKGAVHNGRIYTSSEFGFKVEYGPDSGTQTSATGIIVSYTGNRSYEQGQVEIVGLPAGGASAWDVVNSVAQQVAPYSTQEYEVPNPYIGGVPAVGEAYDVEENGSSNSSGLDRLIVLAAVRGDLAIAVVDMGPYWQFSSSNSTEMGLNDHPSPADQYAALFADPLVNSVAWPSSSG